MNRHFITLLLAQFLTAFADNAILFAAFALITQEMVRGEWYQSALQASFLLAFVLLAPWVGRLADSRAKSSVLVIGNGVKAMGALLMWLQLEPLIAYAVVGIGAAIYGPAKYGILPEMGRRINWCEPTDASRAPPLSPLLVVRWSGPRWPITILRWPSAVSS